MGSSFAGCKDPRFGEQTTRPTGKLQEVACLNCAAASTTPETDPEATQACKILLNGATKREALEHAFVHGEVMLFQTERVPKNRVSGILKSFKVTQHDLSIMASSPPSLWEAVASSQLVTRGEIVHPRSQSWEKQVCPALEAVKKGSPQVS